jgi:hypothetical protein
MLGLFGKKKSSSKNIDNQQKQQETITNLTKKIDEMEEKCKHIEKLKDNENESAKQKLKAGDKNGAKKHLAKKKKYVEQIKQFEGAILLMDEQKMMLENAAALKDIFKTIEEGNDAIKSATKGFSIEQLDKMKDDLDDLKMNQNEITDFFKEYQEEVEDPEISAELDELERQMEIYPEEFAEPLNKKKKEKKEEEEKIKEDEKSLEEMLAA